MFYLMNIWIFNNQIIKRDNFYQMQKVMNYTRSIKLNIYDVSQRQTLNKDNSSRRIHRLTRHIFCITLPIHQICEHTVLVLYVK